MADEKEPSGDDGQIFAFKIMALAVVLALIGTVLERKGIENFFDFSDDSSQQEESIDIENALLKADLRLGDETVNIDGVIVRQSPGGVPVGKQKDGKKGRLVEGPVDRFDTLWWRVDYLEAPDGWVEAHLLTDKIGAFTAINIGPIAFNFIKPFAIILSVIIFLLIIFVRMKMNLLGNIEKKKKEVKDEKKIIKEGHKEEGVVDNDLPVPGLPIGEKPATAKPSNRRWENIQSLMNSYNSNDWKQAIIEADVILDEMVTKMGYKGQGIGEKLKQIEQSDFLTLNQAWEAHKVRNRIAHGDNYVLGKDEAERVIELYKEVFTEFFYI